MKTCSFDGNLIDFNSCQVTNVKKFLSGMHNAERKLPRSYNPKPGEMVLKYELAQLNNDMIVPVMVMSSTKFTNVVTGILYAGEIFKYSREFFIEKGLDPDLHEIKRLCTEFLRKPVDIAIDMKATLREQVLNLEDPLTDQKFVCLPDLKMCYELEEEGPNKWDFDKYIGDTSIRILLDSLEISETDKKIMMMYIEGNTFEEIGKLLVPPVTKVAVCKRAKLLRRYIDAQTLSELRDSTTKKRA